MTDTVLSRKSMSRYRGRKRTNAIWLTLSLVAALFGILWLFLILYSLFWNGFSALIRPGVFNEMTPPPGMEGGLLNAIFGSVVMSAIAVAAGTPIGLLAGTYLAEYGRHARLSFFVRFVNDILLSAPSIVIGLFIWQVMVVRMQSFSALAGSAALMVIVIPVVVRTTENMLLLVPNGLREAAAALGAPRNAVIRAVTWRAARAGIVTGVLLAVARISGETAPLLFTALNNQFWSTDLSKPMANLPVVIFQFAMSPYEGWHHLAWAGALLITAAVLLMSIVARILESSNRS